jgi:hypothetical protein
MDTARAVLSDSCSIVIFYPVKKILAVPDFPEAVAAVDRSVTPRFERYLGIPAAFGTNYREHLSPGIRASVPLGFPRLAAIWTTLGIVDISFRLEKFLFLGTESKRTATISALEGPVFETQ